MSPFSTSHSECVSPPLGPPDDQLASGLPSHLVDIVVDLLDAERDLITCTRLSHLWRMSAHRRLLHTVELDVEDDAGRERSAGTSAGTCDEETKSPYSLDVFLSLLESSPRGSIAKCLKDLTLMDPHSSDHRVTLSVSAIDHLLAKLPSLEHLTLVGILLLGCPTSTPLEGWSSQRPLITLSLVSVAVPCPSWLDPSATGIQIAQLASQSPVDCSFIDLVNLFGSVRTLEIQALDIVGTDRKTLSKLNGLYSVNAALALKAASTISASFRLERLIIRPMKDVELVDDPLKSGDILELLRRSKTLDGLKELEVQDANVICRRFMRTVGAKLDRLELHYGYKGLEACEDTEEVKFQDYGVSNCTKLSALDINAYLPSTSYAKDLKLNYAQFMAILLSSPPTPRLTIHFYYETRSTLDSLLADFDWLRMDRILTSRSVLVNVLVAFVWDENAEADSPIDDGDGMPSSDDAEVMERRLRERLCQLDARNVLEVYL